MSAAIDAKSARARATIAARLLKTVKPWPEGYGLGRSFDDCFEMMDGAEVLRLLLLRAANDPELIAAMKRHGCGSWVEQVNVINAALAVTTQGI